MLRIICLLFSVLLIASCSNNSTSSNNNNNTDSYFVNWTVAGQSYTQTGSSADVGGYVNHTLVVTGTPAGTDLLLTLGIDSLLQAGTYNFTATGNSHVSMGWEASADAADLYTIGAPDAACTIKVTDFASGYIAGSFTGHLGKMIINGTTITYKYVDISGTYKVIRMN
jgi:hypothetical protein